MRNSYVKQNNSKIMTQKLRQSFLILFSLLAFSAVAQIVNVGSGGYITNFPGNDTAGRNGYPSGKPQISGVKQNKPVPTNDWWSKLIKENHADNMFSYPFTLKTLNAGLVVSYVPQGVIDDLLPVIVGVDGLSAEKATVSNYSDWTVTMDWNDGTHNFQTTAGIGMPFLYFTKGNTDAAKIAITSGTVTIDNEIILIEKAKNGASFAIYGPTGSTWEKNGNNYTSTLNGKNYWSLAFLPLGKTDLKGIAEELKRYAYVFPADTRVEWNYNKASSTMRTDFKVETEVKEGDNEKILIGLLPHQWAHSAKNCIIDTKYTYKSIRGELKVIEGNQFSVENQFYGILPTLPYIDTQSAGFSRDELKKKIDAIRNDEIGEWTDSYNDGQLLNRLVQTARVADEIGDTESRDIMLATIKERVENWLNAKSGEVAFIFYYNKDWSTMLGYPAGHGQDTNLNDHHFHWGYFIHAAAFLEQYQPGWAAKWGEMVNLLVRDAASTDREDSMFPFLRNFSPYAGHAWANGFATFPQGNDQESTSESMQFNSSLIHWGTITGNDKIRDLGIYLYTTEQTAIEEYWMDMNDRNFPSTQQYSLVSRIWGNNFDNGTFWTNDLAASYGIELYPIHGGSLYLGHNKEYVQRLWNEIKKNTGITRNEANDNLWHDVMWEYASFISADEAIKMYDSFPDRNLKFGISDAQTYYWLHAMNVLGTVDTNITSDYPVAAAFNNNGRMTYVAHNYTSEPLLVQYSDGYILNVPTHKMVFENAGNTLPVVVISSPKNNSKFELNTPITVTASVTDYNNIAITKVDFFANNNLIGSATSSPYTISWTPNEGVYSLTAKATNAEGKVGISKAVDVSIAVDNTCAETSDEASQGSFSQGYKVSFETIGSTVNVSFQLLDTDREGVVAFLWNKEPFSEIFMDNIGDNTFSSSISGKEIGAEIEVACKFAYAGGMSVTKYFKYRIGQSCQTSVEGADLEQIEVFPNPVTDLLYIGTSQESQEVILYNSQGVELFHSNIYSGEAIDMKGYSPGLYFVTIMSGNGIAVKKVIKK